ncbi:MAG: hypothetical protein ACJASV_003134 [Pseudorhodobacter sp.]|jgi:hypothetical protein
MRGRLFDICCSKPHWLLPITIRFRSLSQNVSKSVASHQNAILKTGIPWPFQSAA